MDQLRERGAVITALGTMSGTSLDGVDAATVRTDGETISDFGVTRYQAYTETQRQVIGKALGQWAGPDVVAAQDVVDQVHRAVLWDLLPADVIGFHGQTLAHAPEDKRTLQVGRGARLAADLATPVVWDFRSDDVRLGGQGAPLAPFFHFACARWIEAKGPVGFLNLGGVGNLTIANPRFERPEDPGALLSFDTGPANAPINDLLMDRRDEPFDADGAVAAQGQVDNDVIVEVLDRPYFAKPPPKSLDRDAFADVVDMLAGTETADAAATLTALCAMSVVQGFEHCPSLPDRLLVTGGGRRNPVLMEMLEAALDMPVDPVEKVGLDGDMLEAQAFAFLAVRVARGLPTSCQTTTGVRAAMSGGTISYPKRDKA